MPTVTSSWQERLGVVDAPRKGTFYFPIRYYLTAYCNDLSMRIIESYGDGLRKGAT